MQVAQRFKSDIAQGMRDAILRVDGGEVFFVCRLDEEGTIADAEVVARGHDSAVPAPLAHAERGDVVVHNHPSGILKPSDADLAVASELAQRGIGSYIVNNTVDDVYVVAEAFRPKPVVPIDADDLAAYLEPGGSLARFVPNYEARESQIAMLRQIADAFNGDLLSVAEAGTGVGKSFAYLLPAFAWAAENEERVVVSTATINLQQQLVEKDIPLVKRLLESDVKAVLVKGRGNYLCRNRLDDALQEDALFQEEDSDLVAIKEWAATTGTGSRSELPFLPDESVWSRVNSDPDACSGVRCRRREDCFLIKARKAAASAGILVVNHHLLFSDLAIRMEGLGTDTTAVLPPFVRVILDEAHNIERSATSFFSVSFSRFTILKHAGRLLRERRGRRFGLLLVLGEALGNGYDLSEVLADVEALREQAEAVTAAGMAALAGEGSVRLLAEDDSQATVGLLQALGELQQRLLLTIQHVERLMRDLDDAESETPQMHDLRSLLRRLGEIASACEKLRSERDDEERIFHIEKRSTGRGEVYVRFVVTPLWIGPILKDALHGPYPTVAFASATLSVGESFEYWKRRIGLDVVPDDRLVEAQFPSPFEYSKRVLLGVPVDAPTPDQASYQAYLSDFVTKALCISEGRALVLFTSYRMLEATYQAAFGELRKLGISCYRQGEDERSRLLTRFNTEVASVLFATDSFWEGVDAPGETLQLVIICRLPFRVPSDPVLLARMDAIRRRGGNPFEELSLPDAVMKLKQGFGRLMRHRDDRGAVLVPDSRIVKKRYGRVFLDSLPATRRSVREGRGVLEDLEDFLYGPGR